jgi:hypothetical protein
MSEPCARYFATYMELVAFVAFVATVSKRADEVRRLAHEALQFGQPEDEREEESEDASAVAAFRRYRSLLLETVLTRAVDNYLGYVSELLALAFLTKPEMLRSDETVPVRLVLEHDTMGDLIEDLAERRVERLAYQSLRDLSQYLRERVGFDLFGSDEHFEGAARLVELRNLVVHNRGVVNRTFEPARRDTPSARRSASTPSRSLTASTSSTRP